MTRDRSRRSSGRSTTHTIQPANCSICSIPSPLVVTAAVFSFSKGIIHTYYGIALAPAGAALAGMTLPTLWRLTAAA